MNYEDMTQEMISQKIMDNLIELISSEDGDKDNILDEGERERLLREMYEEEEYIMVSLPNNNFTH